MRKSVEVDIEVEDILDALEELDDKELRAAGFMRIHASKQKTPWDDVRNAMRRGNQRRLDDLLAGLAWDQGGGILPTGIPVIH